MIRNLPVRKIARIALGSLYLWFGALKLLPGSGPFEELLRSVWGPYLNPGSFIQALAVFEIAAGALLVLDIATPAVTVLIVFHVAGSFVTGVLDSRLAFNLESAGVLALTIAGQYVFKNLLILSNCLFLLDGDSRAHERKLFRAKGQIFVDGHAVPIVTADLSEGGISLHLKEPPQSIWVGKSIQLEIQSPLTGDPLQIDCTIANINRVAETSPQLLRIGIQFQTDALKLWELMPYLSDKPIEPKAARPWKKVA